MSQRFITQRHHGIQALAALIGGAALMAAAVGVSVNSSSGGTQREPAAQAAPASSLGAWLDYRAGERGDAPASSLGAWLDYRAGERGDAPASSLGAWLDYRAGERGDAPASALAPTGNLSTGGIPKL